MPNKVLVRNYSSSEEIINILVRECNKIVHDKSLGIEYATITIKIQEDKMHIETGPEEVRRIIKERGAV